MLRESVKPIMTENVEEIERMLVEQKEWRYLGEVDANKRPKNSLLNQEDIIFKQGAPLFPFSSKQNDEIERIILRRIRDGLFDNHAYNVVQKIEPIEEVSEAEALKSGDIVLLYKEIEKDLVEITDFGNYGFVQNYEIKVVKNATKNTKKRKHNTKLLEKMKNVTILKN